MENFNWKKGFGFGALIWITLFALASAFVALDLMDNTWAQITVAAVAAVMAYILAANTRVSHVLHAISYGSLWVVIGIALDFLVTIRFDEELFTSWSYWLGYGLILIVPLFRIESHKLLTHHA